MEIKNILRFDIKLYHVLVVCEQLDIVDTTIVKGSRVNTIVWGKKLDKQNPLNTIVLLSISNSFISYHLFYEFKVFFKVLLIFSLISGGGSFAFFTLSKS